MRPRRFPTEVKAFIASMAIFPCLGILLALLLPVISMLREIVTSFLR